MTFAAPQFLTKSLPLAFVLMAGVATGAMAQDAAAPATDAAPAAEAAPNAATPAAPVADASNTAGLNMGTEPGAAGQADGIGSSYIEANFEQWEQRCVRTTDGSDPCQLYQLLKDSEGNAVAEFSMFALPAGGQAAAGATIVVPLETLLTENLQLAVDGSQTRMYPYTFCAQIGCIARVGFTAAEVEQFKKGAKATLTIVPVVAPTEKVALDISLKGFTAGFAAVAATNK